MDNWKTDPFIKRRSDIYVTVREIIDEDDRTYKILYEPNRDGDITSSNPFPKGYMPQIGHRISFGSIEKEESDKKYYKIKDILWTIGEFQQEYVSHVIIDVDDPMRPHMY